MSTYIHLLSNGSTDAYPTNTLTNFSNKFPVPMDVDQSYEIGIQSFGFSSQFRSVHLPNNADIPSIIVVVCDMPQNRVSRSINSGFDHLIPEGDVGNGVGSAVGALKQSNEINPDRFFKGLEELVVFRDNGVCVVKGFSYTCTYYQYFLAESSLNDIEISKLQKKMKDETGVSLRHHKTNLTFTFEPNTASKDVNHQYCWIFLHKSFNNSFHFKNVLEASDKSFIIVNGNDHVRRPTHPMYQEMRQYFNYIGGHKSQKDTLFKNEKYCIYLLTRKFLTESLQLNNNVSTKRFDLTEPIFPKYIKIESDQIRPQILNSKYSKDLLVFSPDHHISDYTLREVKAIDFVPLLNNTISSFNIKLLDENNQQLQIASGTPTIIKLVLQKMPAGKETFSVRITSTANVNYPNNTLTHFKVNLPTPLILDKSWRVSLNSISHPTTFATFLNEEDTRIITFFDSATGEPVHHIFQSDYAYNQEELIRELNEFLQTENIGSCALEENLLTFTITKNGSLIINNFIAKVLGYKLINENLTLCAYRSTKKVMESAIQIPDTEHTFDDGDYNKRRILFKLGSKFADHVFKSNYKYNKIELNNEINQFLNMNDIGECNIDPANDVFNISLKHGKLVMGTQLSQILGSATIPFQMEAKQDEPEEYKFKADGRMSMTILKPSYLIVYSNIVQSTIVGGVYNKLLRLVPTPSETSNLEYTIREFEHKEFYDLENSEIDAIDIILCAHDGRQANFASNHDVIVNLEFSNSH